MAPPKSTWSALEAIAGNTPLGQSEDCLTLNVWTPACDDVKRPVMVWIHGGGFTTGTAASPWYSGTNLALQGDVVIVTANYRLGALGFTHLADLGGEAWGSSANCGILDQVRGALRGCVRTSLRSAVMRRTSRSTASRRAGAAW